LIEIAVSVLLLALAIFVWPEVLVADAPEEQLWWFNLLTKIVAGFGGVYVFVRGCDNVVKQPVRRG